MNTNGEAVKTGTHGLRKARTGLTEGTQQDSRSDPFDSAPADDRVIQLRQLGARRPFVLPPPSRDSKRRALHEEGLLLGCSEECHLRIEDPRHRVSRRHARVFYHEGRWSLLDLGSKNGLYVDGIKQQAVQLVPGMLIRVGGVTLVAESRRSLALRSLLQRLLGWGWGDEREAALEKALQDVRNAQIQREPIWLRSEGEGDLATIARELHRVLFSAQAPFVMCDARRQPGERNVRSPANEDSLEKAIIAAKGGTLCVRSIRLPQGFTSFVQKLRESAEVAPGVQVMILCEAEPPSLARMAQGGITIPALRSRSRKQTENVVREVLLEAMAELGVTEPLFPSDRDWILENAANTFDEVIKSARRITALRIAGTVLGAAELLGMAPVSLRRWLGRRGPLPGILRDGKDLSSEDGTGEQEPSE